jgi:hypothetical protein
MHGTRGDPRREPKAHTWPLEDIVASDLKELAEDDEELPECS